MAGDTGKRAERAELRSIHPLMLVSWVPPSLQETQGWHLDTLGANSITGCQKKHSLKPTHIKKGKSSRPSSSHPNCLRGKKRAKPWQLPSQIDWLIFFFLSEISSGHVNTGIDKEDKTRPCRNYCLKRNECCVLLVAKKERKLHLANQKRRGNRVAGCS